MLFLRLLCAGLGSLLSVFMMHSGDSLILRARGFMKLPAFLFFNTPFDLNFQKAPQAHVTEDIEPTFYNSLIVRPTPLPPSVIVHTTKALTLYQPPLSYVAPLAVDTNSQVCPWVIPDTDTDTDTDSKDVCPWSAVPHLTIPDATCEALTMATSEPTAVNEDITPWRNALELAIVDITCPATMTPIATAVSRDISLWLNALELALADITCAAHLAPIELKPITSNVTIPASIPAIDVPILKVPVVSRTPTPTTTVITTSHIYNFVSVVCIVAILTSFALVAANATLSSPESQLEPLPAVAITGHLGDEESQVLPEEPPSTTNAIKKQSPPATVDAAIPPPPSTHGRLDGITEPRESQAAFGALQDDSTTILDAVTYQTSGLTCTQSSPSGTRATIGAVTEDPLNSIEADPPLEVKPISTTSQESSTTHPATDLTNAHQELAAPYGASLQDLPTDGNDKCDASTSATTSHEATTNDKVQEIETTTTTKTRDVYRSPIQWADDFDDVVKEEASWTTVKRKSTAKVPRTTPTPPRTTAPALQSHWSLEDLRRHVLDKSKTTAALCTNTTRFTTTPSTPVTPTRSYAAVAARPSADGLSGSDLATTGTEAQVSGNNTQVTTTLYEDSKTVGFICSEQVPLTAEVDDVGIDIDNVSAGLPGKRPHLVGGITALIKQRKAGGLRKK